MLQNATPALILLLLMVAVAFGLKRWRTHLPGALRRQNGPSLQILSTLALGPQQRVVTVQVGEGEQRVCLVLGVAAGSVTALHCMDGSALPPDAPEPTTTGGSTGFAARLAQLTQPNKAQPHAPR